MSDTSSVVEAAFQGVNGTFSLDLAFDLPSSGFTALFGASGSGKTTVLRCMSGLGRMTGRLKVGGDIWQDSASGIFLKPHRRPVGYVFQESSLFPHLSVLGNLTYGAKRALRRNGGAGLDLDAVVDLLGCGPLLERTTGSLSGGERQRVAIGRALLAQPELLLMDEPLSALDRGSKEEILSYLEAVHRELSIPALYVSHDIAEVSRLADRIVVIAGGRKVAEGPLVDVMERLDLQPHTGRFEAGVVLTAKVSGQDEAYHLTRLEHRGQQIVIPYFAATSGDEVRMRIRARDVALATERPKGISIRNVLEGRVTEIREEPGTAFAETLVDIGGAGLRARLTRQSVDELGLEVGKPVFALIKSITFDRRSLV